MKQSKRVSTANSEEQEVEDIVLTQAPDLPSDEPPTEPPTVYSCWDASNLVSFMRSDEEDDGGIIDSEEEWETWFLPKIDLYHTLREHMFIPQSAFLSNPMIMARDIIQLKSLENPNVGSVGYSSHTRSFVLLKDGTLLQNSTTHFAANYSSRNGQSTSMYRLRPFRAQGVSGVLQQANVAFIPHFALTKYCYMVEKEALPGEYFLMPRIIGRGGLEQLDIHPESLDVAKEIIEEHKALLLKPANASYSHGRYSLDAMGVVKINLHPPNQNVGRRTQTLIEARCCMTNTRKRRKQALQEMVDDYALFDHSYHFILFIRGKNKPDGGGCCVADMKPLDDYRWWAETRSGGVAVLKPLFDNPQNSVKKRKKKAAKE